MCYIITRLISMDGLQWMDGLRYIMHITYGIMHITHNFAVAAKKFGTLPTGATALCATAVLLSHDKPVLCQGQGLATTQHSHAVTNSCCPSVEPQPLSLDRAQHSKRDTILEYIGHCPPWLKRPTLNFSAEGALPTFRPTRHAGWDGPSLW